MKIAFPAVHCFLSLLLDIFSFNKPKIAHMQCCLYTGWCVLLKMPFCKVTDGLGSQVLHSILLQRAAPVHVAGHSRSMSEPLEKLHLCSSPSQAPAMAHGLPARSLCLLLRGLLTSSGGKARYPIGRRMAVLLQGAGGSWGHGERLDPGLSQVGSDPRACRQQRRAGGMSKQSSTCLCTPLNSFNSSKPSHLFCMGFFLSFLFLVWIFQETVRPLFSIEVFLISL